MAAENEASQESALGAYSPVDYMSITSFPRLPEDEPAPAAPLRGRKDEDAFLGDPDTGEALWPHPCPALGGEVGGWCPGPPPSVLSIHFQSPISFIHPLHPGPLAFFLSPVNCLVGKRGIFCLRGVGCDTGGDARTVAGEIMITFGEEPIEKEEMLEGRA